METILVASLIFLCICLGTFCVAVSRDLFRSADFFDTKHSEQKYICEYHDTGKRGQRVRVSFFTGRHEVQCNMLDCIHRYDNDEERDMYSDPNKRDPRYS